MIETVIAVLIITSLFIVLFKLSYMLTGKIMLEHASMRVARARAVGFNDFMCLKAARVSVIPVAGERLWPETKLTDAEELARVGIYMGTYDPAIARGVLEYEGWNRMKVLPGNGTHSTVGLGFSLFDDAVRFGLDGRASIENNYPYYLYEQGL